MDTRFVCSKCGQSGFETINGLETHIVRQHFCSDNALYKCWDAHCNELFATEVARLQHMHLEQHVIDHKLVQHTHLKSFVNLKTLMQMPDEDFVSRRLAINSCLNESINLSFARCAEWNRNNFHRPTNGNAMKERTMPQTINLDRFDESIEDQISSRDLMDESIEAVIESAARRTTRTTATSSVSELRKPILENSGLNDENNKRTCVKNNNLQRPTAPSQIPEMRCILRKKMAYNVHNVPSRKEGLKLGNTEPFDRGNQNTEPEISSSLFVIKEEPSLFDELAETFPAASNRIDKFILGKVESAALSLPSKRSRMETVSASLDENNKRTDREKLSVVKDEPITQLQTSSSLVVKDEPSLIDELAAMIPAPSNYNDSFPSNIGLVFPLESMSSSSSSSSSTTCPFSRFHSKNSVAAKIQKDQDMTLDGTMDHSKVTGGGGPRKRGRQSKDEQYVSVNGLPATAEQITSMTHSELQKLMQDPNLTSYQKTLIKKIRRRGRNKVAAEKSRKRHLPKPKSSEVNWHPESPLNRCHIRVHLPKPESSKDNCHPEFQYKIVL